MENVVYERKKSGSSQSARNTTNFTHVREGAIRNNTIECPLALAPNKHR